MHHTSVGLKAYTGIAYVAYVYKVPVDITAKCTSRMKHPSRRC